MVWHVGVSTQGWKRSPQPVAARPTWHPTRFQTFPKVGRLNKRPIQPIEYNQILADPFEHGLLSALWSENFQGCSEEWVGGGRFVAHEPERLFVIQSHA